MRLILVVLANGHEHYIRIYIIVITFVEIFAGSFALGPLFISRKMRSGSVSVVVRVL